MSVIAYGPGGRVLGVQQKAGVTAELVALRPGLHPRVLGSFTLADMPTRAVADAAGNIFVLLHGQELLQVGPDGSIRARSVLATGDSRAHFVSTADAKSSASAPKRPARRHTPAMTRSMRPRFASNSAAGEVGMTAGYTASQAPLTVPGRVESRASVLSQFASDRVNGKPV